MPRMICVALLNLFVLALVRAEEPRPPWQRLLAGDDAKKASELKKQIGQLETADMYDEVIHFQEELLALRTKVQGADHWQTVNDKWGLVLHKKVADLPEEKRSGWRKTKRGAVEADQLEQKAQYPAALPLRQERLRWCRDVLGEDHPDTATSYNEVAFNLNAQGRFAEAGPLLQKGLDIRRKVLGEKHPDTARSTATSYNNVAFNLNAQGK